MESVATFLSHPADPPAALQYFTARAFAEEQMQNGRPVLGNPACACYCPSGFPPAEERSQLAREMDYPMMVFVTPETDPAEGRFSTLYYTPQGIAFPLCGHATMVASMQMSRLFGVDELQFYPAALQQVNRPVVVPATVSGGFVQIDLPARASGKYPFGRMNELLAALHVSPEEVEQVRFCETLRDVIVQVNEPQVLRAAAPDMEALASWLNVLGDARGVILTSRSTELGFDYEMRIFSPHVGIDEDISCGSANCSLLPFWMPQLNKPAGAEIRVLCPYNDSVQHFGGVETLHYLETEEMVRVGGYVTQNA